MDKVLLVCGKMENGGIQNVIMNIVRQLSKSYEFHIMTLDNQNHIFDSEANSYGCRIIDLSNIFGGKLLKSTTGARFFWRIYESKIQRIMIKNGPYRAVHCNFDVEAGFVLRAAAKVGIGIRICHLHRMSGSMPENIINRLILMQWAKLRERYVTDRIGCSDMACRSIWKREDNYKVIYSPYDESRFRFSEKKEVSCKAPVLIQVGSYSDNKNQKFTLSVFKSILSKYPSARLIYIGFENQNMYLSEMKSYINEYNMKDSVRFYPSDADIPALLDEASYFIFPSCSEGFGIVLIEAQAVGIRCFVSDVVSIETNCGGCTYLSLNAGAEYWAQKICECFEQDHGIKKEFDCKKFYSVNMAKQISEIYEAGRYEEN